MAILWISNTQWNRRCILYMLRCIIEVGFHYTWGYQATTRERLSSASKPRKNSPLSQKVSLSGIQYSYMFLCLWLNEQLGWTIYTYIYMLYIYIYQHHVLAQQPVHPCLGEGANQSSSKSNINLKIRFLTDDNARRGSWNQPCKNQTPTQRPMSQVTICTRKNTVFPKGPGGLQGFNIQNLLQNVPSGNLLHSYFSITRNSGFSHEQWWIFP